MAKGKEYCIICGERRSGLPVEDDYVISAIRWFKANVTKNEKNNSLVVCRDCYSKYKRQRKRYEAQAAQLHRLRESIFMMVGLLISQHGIRTAGLSGGLRPSVFLLPSKLHPEDKDQRRLQRTDSI